MIDGYKPARNYQKAILPQAIEDYLIRHPEFFDSLADGAILNPTQAPHLGDQPVGAIFEARPDVLFCCSDFASRYADGQEFHKHLVTWHNDARGWEQIVGPAVPYSSIAPLPPR